jgi:hypothetical protein
MAQAVWLKPEQPAEMNSWRGPTWSTQARVVQALAAKIG